MCSQCAPHQNLLYERDFLFVSPFVEAEQLEWNSTNSLRKKSTCMRQPTLCIRTNVTRKDEGNYSCVCIADYFSPSFHSFFFFILRKTKSTQTMYVAEHIPTNGTKQGGRKDTITCISRFFFFFFQSRELIYSLQETK